MLNVCVIIITPYFLCREVSTTFNNSIYHLGYSFLKKCNCRVTGDKKYNCIYLNYFLLKK